MMSPHTSYTVNEDFSNVLLISGSGRERGKTMLACNIIRLWKKDHDIVAIKISAHLHEDPGSVYLIQRSDGYAIWEEKTVSPKDSGRFLEAGAGKVFYIEARDTELLKAFRYVYGLCSERSMIVCESGGLGRLIKPAVMLFIQHEDDIIGIEKAVLRNLSDRIVFSSGPELSDPSLILKILDHRWNMVIADRDVPHPAIKDPPYGSNFENSSA